LVMTVKHQNHIREGGKSRLKSRIALFLSSPVLPKIVKIKLYKTIVVLVALYGYETWPVTLREEYISRTFKNRVI